MPETAIQASFNSGEWSPKLYARVDLTKYRSGAALLENFFVDYRGGASTRPGTKYILHAYKPAFGVRLIPFQASFSIGYVLEFGQNYIRPFFDGAPLLEPSFAITSATQADPCVVGAPGNNINIGDWIFITGVVGMTQLNDRYFNVAAIAGGGLLSLTDLNGTQIDSAGYGAYISGGTVQRVFTIASPYLGNDVGGLKYAQNVDQLILCHASYPPYVLTLISPLNWTMLPIVFGSTAAVPTGVVVSTILPAGPVSYTYAVTSIDGNGEESAVALGGLTGRADLRTTAGSNSITWNAAAGAVAYNVYKTDVSYFGVPITNQIFGYIGTATNSNVLFIDSNVAPDYTQTPPIDKNPFAGAGVAFVTVTAPGVYTVVPGVSFTGAGSTIGASATAVLQVQGTPTVGAAGAGYAPGDTVLFTNNVTLIVNTVGGGGAVTSWRAITAVGASPGAVTAGNTPANPVIQIATSGAGAGTTANLVWGVGLVPILSPGSGYLGTPTVVFSAGAATATATVSSTAAGNPTVPGFFQQRLVLAAPRNAPQTFYMSKPGQYFNFDVSDIAQADDSITGTLVSGQLNTIKAMVPQTSGLLMFTDRNSWLINGGSPGSAVSPSALVANAQSFNGLSDVHPIVSNFDVLYVQAKGSIVRDSAYNIYANVYTGTDISAISSHLFYGFTVTEWAWAEEPFKVVWAVRNDGTMLTLTFLKEQEFIGWAHSVTQGSFESVCTVVENTATAGEVDAIYTVVFRNINGIGVKYIERVAERTYPGGVEDAWTVDCALNYTGAPATNFTGAEFLAAATCTGLADGVPIPAFVMGVDGTFTLGTPASKVTVGLGFTAQLQTLPLELGDPTVQGKVKSIDSVTVRVADTLGLQIGSSFTTLVDMQDFQVGQVSSTLTGQESQVVTGLVDGDGFTQLDSTFTVPGQFCIQQSLPYPATILGVFPNVTMGDDDRRER